MKLSTIGCFALVIILVAVFVARLCVYTVSEKEQVVVTRFGEVQGKPVTQAGLKFRLPVVDKVNPFSKQVLGWDGNSTEMPTKDKTFISVDTYARWRIVDALVYFEKFREDRRAISRLNDVLGSETRNTIAKHNLIEVVRSTKDRVPEVSEDIAEADVTGKVGKLLPIRKGRSKLEEEIFNLSKAKLKSFGIELLDLRFKRVNYNQNVRNRIYDRMISERKQIAERFRSEGAGEAAKISGSMERELATIESAAYREAETIKGAADAKATEIYAKAYGQSEDAAEFYEFVRTMNLYEQMFAGESTVVLSTDSDLFKYLKSDRPNAKPAKQAPAKRPAQRRAPAPAPRQ